MKNSYSILFTITCCMFALSINCSDSAQRSASQKTEREAWEYHIRKLQEAHAAAQNTRDQNKRNLDAIAAKLAALQPKKQTN